VLQDLETDDHLSLSSHSRRSRSIEILERDRSDQADSLSELRSLRVLIADDVAPTRRFLRAVLEHCRQFEVVGEASDGQASIQMADVLQPDLVLLDLSMPLVDGASALRGIREVAPGSNVIVVSGMNPELGMSLLDTGAVGFVPKGIPPFELLERLGSILELDLTVESRDTWDAILMGNRGVVFFSDPATRHLVIQVLERCGVIVTAETDTAATMLEVVDLSHPDVVVIDLSVDGMPDTSLISEICTRSPRSAIVVYSGSEMWKDKALAAGAAAFVLEPRVDELADQIRKLTLNS
jgi:DNA-binding NarL/FixJ family response regulator